MHLTLGVRQYEVTDDGKVTRLAYEFLTPSGAKAVKKAKVLRPTLTKNGYLRFCLSAGHFMAHRIVWMAFNGEIPALMDIDHINGNRQDNRLANLRLATRAQNALNRRGANKNSKSGVRGVYFHKSSRQWCFEVSGKVIASSKERGAVLAAAAINHG